MRIENKPAFTVSGVKTWISGQDNSRFATFWADCEQKGIVERLKSLSSDPQQNQTHSRIIGVSRVENDPNNRAFDFYIVSESTGGKGLETFTIAGGDWAIFEGNGNTPMALIDAEMEAFMHWLPESGYVHDSRPEMEVYLEGTGVYVEFWLPIRRKVR